MSSFSSLLSGTKILEERKSKYNGDIKVVKSLGYGTYIQVEGLTQSGGVVTDVWRTTLKKLRTKEIKNCLILGLGGGSAAKLVRKYWPETKITGVDIDPVMVDLGRKYLGLDEQGVTILISDAKGVCNKLSEKRKKFDLILVDLYVGDKVPEIFEENDFIKTISKLLPKDGIAVFNRLYQRSWPSSAYYGEKRPQAMRFLKRLEKVFVSVDPVYPQANVMFLCYNK